MPPKIEDTTAHTKTDVDMFDESVQDGPPQKKPKVVDVCINGDSFEQNAGKLTFISQSVFFSQEETTGISRNQL